MAMRKKRKTLKAAKKVNQERVGGLPALLPCRHNDAQCTTTI